MMRTNVVRVGKIGFDRHEFRWATRLVYVSPRRVGLAMAQAPVNALDDGENVMPDLKLVVMEETTKVLEGVQLKVIICQFH